MATQLSRVGRSSTMHESIGHDPSTGSAAGIGGGCHRSKKNAHQTQLDRRDRKRGSERNAISGMFERSADANLDYIWSGEASACDSNHEARGSRSRAAILRRDGRRYAGKILYFVVN